MLHDGDGWTLDCSMVRVKARAGNEPSQILKFHNQSEGPYSEIIRDRQAGLHRFL